MCPQEPMTITPLSISHSTFFCSMFDMHSQRQTECPNGAVAFECKDAYADLQVLYQFQKILINSGPRSCSDGVDSPYFQTQCIPGLAAGVCYVGKVIKNLIGEKVIF